MGPGAIVDGVTTGGRAMTTRASTTRRRTVREPSRPSVGQSQLDLVKRLALQRVNLAMQEMLDGGFTVEDIRALVEAHVAAWRREGR